MKLTLAMLADHALAHPDGKLYITGGSLHSVQVAEFPATYPHLSLALEVQVEPTEASRVNRVRIQAHTASGEALITPTSLSVPRPSSVSQNPQFVQFVFNIDRLIFPEEGTYTFSVELDDLKQAELQLQVRRGIGPQLESMAEAFSSLDRGYEAFRSGDLSAAEQHFKTTLEIAPEFSLAHNNIGFVYLAQGDVERALAAFDRARELGFERLELLDPNRACCFYLLNDYAAALPLFESSLVNGTFVASSVLFGICRTELFLVQLPSASAYAALMALNAAWSALGMQQRETAVHYLAVAMAVSEATDLGADFNNSKDLLSQDLREHTL